MSKKSILYWLIDPFSDAIGEIMPSSIFASAYSKEAVVMEKAGIPWSREAHDAYRYDCRVKKVDAQWLYKAIDKGTEPVFEEIKMKSDGENSLSMSGKILLEKGDPRLEEINENLQVIAQKRGLEDFPELESLECSKSVNFRANTSTTTEEAGSFSPMTFEQTKYGFAGVQALTH